MKKFGLNVLGVVFLPIIIFLLFAHYLGLLFAASIAAAAIVGWGFSSAAAFTYLSIAWKVYAGLGVFTFLFLTTMTYQHCCAGMQYFTAHLKHHGWNGAGKNFVDAVIWPWSWFALDRYLRGWYLSLADAMCNAVMYWLVDRWRGTNFTVLDVQTGETTTTYVKTPEIRDAIRDTIVKNITKEG